MVQYSGLQVLNGRLGFVEKLLIESRLSEAVAVPKSVTSGGTGQFGPGSGPFSLNAESEPDVPFRKCRTLSLNLAFRFNAFGSAFNCVPN
jgi:hypothetical protein